MYFLLCTSLPVGSKYPLNVPWCLLDRWGLRWPSVCRRPRRRCTPRPLHTGRRERGRRPQRQWPADPLWPPLSGPAVPSDPPATDCPRTSLLRAPRMSPRGRRLWHVIIFNLYHSVWLRQRVHTVTISRSTVTHAERLPIKPRSTAHTMGYRRESSRLHIAQQVLCKNN